jgi:hypothetical protein
LTELDDVVAEVDQETTATVLPVSPSATSLVSVVREAPVTLCDDGEARLDRPSALLALPASSDFRPESGDDDDAVTTTAVAAAAAAAL